MLLFNFILKKKIIKKNKNFFIIPYVYFNILKSKKITKYNFFVYEEFNFDFFKIFNIYNNFKSKKNYTLKNYFLFLQHKEFYSQLIGKPFNILNIDVVKSIPVKFLNYIVVSTKRVNFKKYYIMFSNYLLEVLLISIWYKNLILWANWIKIYFEKKDIKKHRKLFLLLKYLINKFIWLNKDLLKMKGIRLILKGKFGKSGSIRKSKKYLQKGVCSRTNKELKMLSKTLLIRTNTGVFSIKINLFFF